MLDMMDPEVLQALVDLLDALVWPIIVLLVLIFYREAFAGILANLEEITLPGGFAAKVRRQAQKEVQAAEQLEERESEKPTERQIEAAERIGTSALGHDLTVVRDQVRQFASEYERVRSTMKRGKERLRRMRAAATKLRTLAVAARPLLDELALSSSQGERLAAVVMLQVRPERERIPWLGETAAEDMTFVGHQACISLLGAAHTFRDHDTREAIREQVNRIREALDREARDHDREQILPDIEKELEATD